MQENYLQKADSLPYKFCVLYPFIAPTDES